MATAGGGLSSQANVAGSNSSAPARARFPGRPWTSRSRLRTEKRPQRGRLGSEDGDTVTGGPRPIDIGQALNEDPSLLRLLGVTEKHRRQRDAGFYSSASEEEEDFTGFGTEFLPLLSVHYSSGTSPLPSSLLNQEKPPPAPDLALKQKPGTELKLEGNGGKVAKRGQGARQKEGRYTEGAWTTVKLGAQKMASGSGVKSAGRQATATTRRARGSAKADHASSSGRKRSRDKPAKEPRGSSSTSSTKQGKLVCTLTVVKSRRKACRGKEAGNDSKQETKPQVSTNRRRGHAVLDSSQKAAQSPKPVKGKQRRRSRGASSVAGAEAGSEAGAEAGAVAGAGAGDEPSGLPRGPAQPRRRRRNVPYFGKRRKSLIGKKRKPGSVTTSPTDPVKRRARRRSVFYTLEPTVPLKQEDQGQAVEREGGVQPVIAHLASPVVSARSSRVIKLPRRFLDEEELPRARGKGKSQGKQESDIDEDMCWSPELKSEGEQRTPKTSSKMNPGSSHLSVYEKLKNLTSKLSRKNRDPGGTPEDGADSNQTTVKRRRRRRSKLTMEELGSPGVVRKLAVLISGASAAGTVSAKAWEEGEYNAESVKREDGGVTVDQGDLSQRVHLSNKRMLHLVKRAKVQLIKIDQQKLLKSSQVVCNDLAGGRRRRRRRRVKGANHDGTTQEQPVGGPRIKHVCRAAAVALGQPRAMVPDDIPRLSALPLHEREGICPSPAAEDVAYLSDQDSVASQEHKSLWVRKFKKRLSAEREFGPGGRSTRCGRCKGCHFKKDCGTCINCLDKPKFGGPNTKRQCCVYRKCERIKNRAFKRTVTPYRGK
ncbi:histone-lysine N-methyltransferase 2A-like [Osmerus eperlanus]|uniref:histone-lysine N-methyltransferase 2A-like n=1 Tax=Osmerus eperlanus TaxID=29151 RepID=UPI002E111FD1